jgi:probable selenium-dependent hydroxylase accessory protein YqeC
LNKSSGNPQPLAQALGIGPHDKIVALAGAGGKTTTMYRLAHELTSKGLRIVTGATTQILPPKPHESPQLILPDQLGSLDELKRSLDKNGHITIGKSIQGAKVVGADKDFPVLLTKFADHVIMEADGALGMSVKAPENWEPLWPDGSDLVVAVIGLDCLGKSANENNVFRLERFLELTGLKPGAPIHLNSIVKLAAMEDGLFRGAPYGAKRTLFLNKRDVVDYPVSWDESASLLFSMAPPELGRLAVGSAKAGFAYVHHRGEFQPGRP